MRLWFTVPFNCMDAMYYSTDTFPLAKVVQESKARPKKTKYGPSRRTTSRLKKNKVFEVCSGHFSKNSQSSAKKLQVQKMRFPKIVVKNLLI